MFAPFSIHNQTWFEKKPVMLRYVKLHNSANQLVRLFNRNGIVVTVKEMLC